MRARDLYVGDHWAIARSLPEVARSAGLAPRLWVASAGYGLVPEDAPLRCYSATFTPGDADSIAETDATGSTSKWWGELARYQLDGVSAPRSLAELARSSPRGSIYLVVASRAYVDAMADDLRGLLAQKARLVIVAGAPGPAEEALHRAWVPSSARLCTSLGGALTSLHVRVARHLIGSLGRDLSADTARACVEQLVEQSPARVLPVRQRTDDDSVRAFIRAGLRRDPSATHTTLLRDYRGAGQACEQKRFRAIFLAEASS